MPAGWHLRVAVNLSAVQLRQPDFAALIERILGDSRLAASALELEVTESVFLDPSKMAITKTLHEVAEMGVQLAIDDFGTGYSSLAYLKHLPVRPDQDRPIVRARHRRCRATRTRSSRRSSRSAAASASRSPPRAWRPSASSPFSAAIPVTRCRAICSPGRHR